MHKIMRKYLADNAIHQSQAAQKKAHARINRKREIRPPENRNP